MPLRFRLIVLVIVTLATSVVLGGVVVLVNASRSVRTEMLAALQVGRQTVDDVLRGMDTSPDPGRDLDDLVASFKGSRHLRVSVTGTAAAEEQPVHEAATGQEAIASFRGLSPDLVVLDLNLPGMGGIEVLRRLKIESSNVRVLVISMYDNPAYVARVIKAGARGYVSKNAPPQHVIEGIRRVSAGRIYIEHEMAQELALENLTASANPLDSLSSRDVEILRLLAEGNSLTEIATAIGISYKTVANHCTRLKARLATPRMADLIRLAISCGLSSQMNRGEMT